MPEGDTIFRAAEALQRALAGRIVTRFESVYPAVTRVAEDHPVVGRTVEAVFARGKHLLIAFSGDLVLRTHMRMNGSWHLYRAGVRWLRPVRDMRVLVGAGDVVAVGFNVPVAELLTARELARQRDLQALGPDLLADRRSPASNAVGSPEAVGVRSPSFEPGEVLRRMRAHAESAVGDVLLNQRIVAGIGNVFKSEILFVARIDPFTPVVRLTDGDLERIIGIARDLLAANVMAPAQTLTRAIGRRTTRSLDAGAKLWVYSRGGKPCRRCGALILARKTGLDARLTYWCPRCQPPPA
jgi:endonuclease-8